MKKLLFALCMLTIPLTCFSDDGWYLIIEHKDGSVTELSLKAKPILKFEGDKLVADSEETSAEFDRSGISRISYKLADTKLTSPTESTRMTMFQGALVAHHIDPTASVAIYTISGQPLSVPIQRVGETVTVSLVSLPKGEYIIKIGDVKFKYSKP